RSGRGLKASFEDVCVRQVALYADLLARRSDSKASPIARIEERGKHRIGIEAGQATPNNLPAAVYQRRELTVPDHAELFEPHFRNLPRSGVSFAEARQILRTGQGDSRTI